MENGPSARSQGRSRLLVYIDGFCPYCRASGRAIQALDLLGRCRVVSFRHDPTYRTYGITPEALEQVMHVVVCSRGTYRVARGYGAVLEVIRHLPPLWWLWPIAWLLGAVGLGERAYRWLADHRLIVPDPRHCRDSACPVPPRDSDGP